MIGYLVMAAWPIIVFWMFARFNPATALGWAIIGGYLLLPENISINLPAVPPIDKATVSAVAALVAAAVMVRPALERGRGQGGQETTVLTGLLPRNRAVLLLIVLLFLGIAGTVATNGDTLRFVARQLPGLRLYDAGSLTLGAVSALLPFIMARKYMAAPEAQTRLLIVLAIAGLLYSLPALYEVRMSPQLSRMIYGYFPHDWRQHIRAGGYRPVVFLPHGLWLAIFFSCSFLSALALWRMTSGRMAVRWLGASLWLLVTLVVAKGLGALAIGLMLGAATLFLPLRLRVLGAAVLAGAVLVYPMLRGADLVPTEQIIALANDIDTARAESLTFRIVNEDILLAKANERPLFGWGSWGRNRVFDEEGSDISVTDGYWVMAIGTKGWVGYLAETGLLTLPLILMAFRWRRLGLTPATAGIAVALTANLIDLIPNATLTPVTWLMAGALAGRLELGRAIPPAAPEPQGDGGEGAALPVASNPYTRVPHRHPTRSMRGSTRRELS
ncbi:hypothetical protein [Paracoccus sanguinis]|uniref:hypothetical protein n=1 Tax=Paracoccus sanguinis TaxID=1545044 RepID=UPI00068F1693|nr:hypothetical protein [Paracoccus sanguinis]